VKYLVCAYTGHFADDVHARCATCDAAVVHRPHVPADATKICPACAGSMMETQPVTIQVTEKTLRERALYYAKTPGVPS
jgi:hypothetical protein